DGDAQVVAGALRHRDRELAARQEARLFAALRDEVRLGEALEQAAVLQRPDRGAKVVLLAEEEQVQEIGDAELAFGRRRRIAEPEAVLVPLLIGPRRRRELARRRAAEGVVDAE